MPRIMLIAGVAVHLTILGCTPHRDQVPVTVTVLAAASLNDVLADLAEKFEETHSAAVAISAGASGALCTQIELGGRCDVFVSADPALVDRLDAAGRVVPASRCVLGQNRLVVAVATPNVEADPWPGALASQRISRISLADPDSAPAGRYAKESLENLALWERLQAKLVRAGDVRSAARLLAMRTVDAAIVYETDVAATSGIAAVYVFSAGVHAPIEYVAAVIASRAARSRPHETAIAGFLGFLRSDAAQVVWRKHGFAVTTKPTKTESS